MTVIPQGTLRNDVSDVLRRAEAGEHFTITVAGRPVAELGPIKATGPRRFVPGDEVRALFADLPPDTTLMAQLREEFDDEDPGGAALRGAPFCG